ncbi:MAG: hypothetical protein QME79_09745 [Bacillota bacterium]|nr:hypothetical protein [Bacillota bacterium]
MPIPRRSRRRLVQGTRYTGEPAARSETPSPSAGSAYNRLAHLNTSPGELGLIGAELAKRLTLAAEEFLSELAAEQVRGSFRGELGGLLAEEPDE